MTGTLSAAPAFSQGTKQATSPPAPASSVVSRQPLKGATSATQANCGKFQVIYGNTPLFGLGFVQPCTTLSLNCWVSWGNQWYEHVYAIPGYGAVDAWVPDYDVQTFAFPPSHFLPPC